MKRIFGLYVLVPVFALFILASMSVFVVQETQQWLVLRLGKPVRVVSNSGLNFKIPLVETLVSYDRRILDLDPPRYQVILADQKRLNVDAYLRFRIKDPLLFYQTMNNESRFNSRIERIVDGSLRQVLGGATLSDLLTEKRGLIMKNILSLVGEASKIYGVEIVDFRLGRTDLPVEASQSVYNRMSSEREREAKELRAQGSELAQGIRSNADRQKVEILSSAKKEAEILRGSGDAEAIKIWSRVANQAPEFFAFYRSLKAYETSLAKQDKTLILSPNSEFFSYFNKNK
jgi:membrane protease subunit HflC